MNFKKTFTLCFAIAASAVFAQQQAATANSTTTQPAAEQAAQQAASESLTIIGVGDIMMGLNYPDEKPALPAQDGELTFSEVKDILRDADLTTGNLEGTLLNKGGLFMVSSNYSEFNLSVFSKNALAAVASVHSSAKTLWNKSQDIDFVGSGHTKDSCLVATLVEV